MNPHQKNKVDISVRPYDYKLIFQMLGDLPANYSKVSLPR